MALEKCCIFSNLVKIRQKSGMAADFELDDVIEFSSIGGKTVKSRP
jgi:hypothetical protein